jgi:hypothetical protein
VELYVSVARLAAAVALTIAIEAVVYRLLVPRAGLGLALAGAAAVNLITVPLANVTFTALVAHGQPLAHAFAATEAGVMAAETPLIRLVLGVGWTRSLALSAAANLCSLAMSPFFR